MSALNSYQKLATFILRLVAAVWTAFLVLSWSMYVVEAVAGVNVQHYPAHTVIGNMAYIVVGLLVLLFSKPLGRLLGRGLGE
jgi:hypothetical protein